MSLPANHETDTHFADGEIKRNCLTCRKKRPECGHKRNVGIGTCTIWEPKKSNGVNQDGVN